MNGYIYVASPYTSPHEYVRLNRYRAVRRYMHRLFTEERAAYSPIMHWHQLAVDYKLPADHGPWLVQDQALLEAAADMHVLMLPGWKSSRGVQHEITIWRTHRLCDPTFIDGEPFAHLTTSSLL